jgi:hypothetical protein
MEVCGQRQAPDAFLQEKKKQIIIEQKAYWASELVRAFWRTEKCISFAGIFFIIYFRQLSWCSFSFVITFYLRTFHALCFAFSPLLPFLFYHFYFPRH